MWTATIKEKGTSPQGTYVDVNFSDGTTTVTERCIPQDLNGFKYWVKGRLATFNCKDDINATYNIDDKVDVTDTEKQGLSQDEIELGLWRAKFVRLQSVQKLIDLGIVANDNPKVVALRNDLKDTIKADYIDRI
jgi:hypothetical protein